MRYDIVHPKMLENLHRFFIRTVDIQEFTPGTQDAYGEITVGTWTDVEGLTEMPCQIGPAARGKEKRTDSTPLVYEYRIVIAGYETGISEKHRAVMDDGLVYEIMRIEHDGQKKLTSLSVRKAAV